MGYRIREHKPPKPKRSLDVTTTPSKIYIHDGEIAHLAFPCWYQEVHKPVPVRPHNKHLHDYLGWPAPGKPDHSCQLEYPLFPGSHHFQHLWRYIDLRSIYPIHLAEEGYTDISVSLNASDDEEGIEILSAYIDQRDDWVIRVNVETSGIIDEPKRFRMSVFALAEDRKDLAVLADLIVLPASYIEEE